MNWKCKIIGHKMRYTEPGRGIFGAAECVRCDYRRPEIILKKPQFVPKFKPAPVCNLSDFYGSALEILSDHQIGEIVKHAQSKEDKQPNVAANLPDAGGSG